MKKDKPEVTDTDEVETVNTEVEGETANGPTWPPEEKPKPVNPNFRPNGFKR
jgi:hypothetical protein